MPCYRCGARQNDPVRGASPWRRGVRADEQVLVCPDCQHNSDWQADLDRCPVCGSTALFRRLGATVCRDCEARRANRGALPTAAGAPVAGGTSARAATAVASGASGSGAGGAAARGMAAVGAVGSGAPPGAPVAAGTPLLHGRDATPERPSHRDAEATEPRAADVEHDLAREVAAAIDRVLGRA